MPNTSSNGNTQMPDVEPRWKDPAPKSAKGRARPDEPLRYMCERCRRAVATVRHHKRRRSQGGTDDESNTADLCEVPCHQWVHANPTQAYIDGWLTRTEADDD